jgi:hypothetical protein
VVTAEGRTGNSGELLINNSGEGELKTTTPAQTFSLIVTAEPYFAVRQPSEVVVLENEVRKDTKGRIFPISDYKLMRRAQYQTMGNPLALSLDLEKVPLEMYEARNAVEIARSRGAEKYAAEIFAKADGGLKLAENALARKANKREIISGSHDSAVRRSARQRSGKTSASRGCAPPRPRPRQRRKPRRRQKPRKRSGKPTRRRSARQSWRLPGKRR